MATLSIDSNNLGMMLDLLLNGPDQVGDDGHAFVLVICRDFGKPAAGPMLLETTIVSNVSPSFAAKILHAGAEHVDQENN